MWREKKRWRRGKGASDRRCGGVAEAKVFTCWALEVFGHLYIRVRGAWRWRPGEKEAGEVS
jgi:hypothetical protein